MSERKSMFVVHSEDPEAEFAIDEIFEQCDEVLGERHPKACIIFAGIEMDHNLILDEINKKWPGIKLIGCTTDGEMSSELGFLDDTLSMTVFDMDDVVISTGVGASSDNDVSKICVSAIEQARAGLESDPAFCLITPDGFGFSVEQIVNELSDQLGDQVPIFGGIAGDRWKMKGTYQFCNESLYRHAVPIMMFSGPVTFAYGISSGWKPIGEPAVVTKSENNIVIQIDNRPAIEYYEKILGEGSKPSGEYPLAVLNDENEMAFLRAAPGHVDPETGAVTFFADIKEGSRVGISVAKREDIMEGCRKSLEMAKNNFDDSATLEGALLFSCAGRKMLLGTKIKQEMEYAKSILGDIPINGFYGYGELGPNVSDSKDMCCHNETFVTVLIGKKE